MTSNVASYRMENAGLAGCEKDRQHRSRIAQKTLGAHRTRPPHFLGGVHKLDVPYSARREPRTRAQT